ncbi:DoxX family protein [Propioniciclava tarda]|uniref:DoxX family protein n=1 Tax=Propioniciclava tarda TaxID=433330 RepID=A0A4Q9KJA1_PROTD|nr:DoxX family protein [Propioniciclava tarda]TBT92140.1 DoxX family protein [Propioniciclava tarda]SMO84191.1 Uncharacterized membrane protein YphA, DoxX/SURF4 family [Propioniciclava tarda]
MAWNPLRKDAPEPVEPQADEWANTDAPAPGVQGSSPAAEPEAAFGLPQSDAVADAFAAAQRDAETRAAQVAAPEVVAPVIPAQQPVAAPAALRRFGGATKYVDGAVPAAAAPVPAAPVPADPAAPAAPVAVTNPAPTTPAAPAPIEPVSADQAVRAASDELDPDSLYRPGAARTGDTAVMDESVTAEQARLERERAARREARMAALAPGAEVDAAPAAPAAPVAPPKRVTDKFSGSFGLFVLRVVTAAILLVHGLNGIINSKPVIDVWSNTVLPYPRYIALGVSIAELAIALMLLFGILTRVAGFLLAGIMGATLAFVMWGPWAVFEPGGMGFIGEHELLLAAVGLALLFVGAGGWSVDYMMRRSRVREGLEF